MTGDVMTKENKFRDTKEALILLGLMTIQGQLSNQ